MINYSVSVKFKNEPVLLSFNIGSDKDLKKSIQRGWADEDVFRIGDYFISVPDILWIKVGDGANVEEFGE